MNPHDDEVLLHSEEEEKRSPQLSFRKSVKMSFMDTLHRHWKKLAVIGVLAVVGICVAIGLAVSKDVEKPADADASEGGSFGAQKGGHDGSSQDEEYIVSNGVRVPRELRSFNKEHVIPNFFNRQKDPKTGELTPPDSEYQGGDVIFVLNQNSGGQIMRLCLERVAGNSLYLVTTKNYDDTVNKIKEDKRLPSSWVAGEMALGLCDYLPEGAKCSYFTVFSDAYERALSNYVTWCQSKPTECENVDIVQYVKEHGNYFLKQLMQSSSSNHGEASLDQIDTGTQHLQEEALQMSKDGIKAWFSSVCTTHDINECFRTLQHVYNEKFYDRCGGENLGTLRADATSKSSGISDDVLNIIKGQVAGGIGGEATFHDVVEKIKKQLEHDPEVKTALHADEEIYKASEELFENEIEDRRRRE